VFVIVNHFPLLIHKLDWIPMGPHPKGRLLGLPANMRLWWKWLRLTHFCWLWSGINYGHEKFYSTAPCNLQLIISSTGPRCQRYNNFTSINNVNTVHYSCKLAITLATGINIILLFSSSMKLLQNKLGCLGKSNIFVQWENIMGFYPRVGSVLTRK